MSIRWRKSGELVCAAMSGAMNGDTYIDDRLHHQLHQKENVIIADVEHEKNGLWHWVGGNNLRAIKEFK